LRRRSSGRVGNSRAGYCDEPDDNAIRPITRAPEETELTAYLLVPGANHGGWWYDPLVERLEAAGHIAVAPTPLGLDPEAEPPHEVITLDDHVTQFVRALRAVPVEAGAPQGRDAVLVGHSYGGSIISAVADAEPDLVRALVYLDALVPENGDSLVDDQRRRARLVRQRLGAHRRLRRPAAILRRTVPVPIRWPP